MPEIQDPIYNCIQVKTPDVQDQVQRRYIPIISQFTVNYRTNDP